MGTKLPEWFREHEQEARGYVLGRLKSYPAINPRSLADRGVDRAGEITEFLSSFFNDDYFPRGVRDYVRWLFIAGHREALRFVLTVEQVEVCLHKLPADRRIILQLRYIDQMCDEEVARVMKMGMKSRPFFDAKSARTCSINAYKALCDILEKHLPQKGAVAKGRHRDFSTVFPLFPGLTAEELR
jgi:hypothetical protein